MSSDIFKYKLFDTVDDFMKYVPNIVSMDEEKVFINCTNASVKHIIPILGKDIFDCDDVEVKDLLKYVQANFAAFEIQQIANMIITNSSASYDDGTNLKANFGEKQDALSYYSSTADTYLDMLMNVLKEKNIETTSKVQSKFFKSIDEFEQFRYISNSSRTFIALQPMITLVENIDIIPKLGDKLNDILLDNNKYSKLIYAIKSYIAVSAILSAIPTMKIRYSSGINIVTFISKFDEQYNKAEQENKMKQLSKEKEDISICLDKELDLLFTSEINNFYNDKANSGFAF